MQLSGEMGGHMGALAEVATHFIVLADTTRLRLLKMLEVGESYCSELAMPLNVSRSTASRQLKLLAGEGLVVVRRPRREAYYSLAPKGTRGGRLARDVCRRLEGDRTVEADGRRLRREKELKGGARHRKR
jgi:DNA-binding transcriptional ArsR family regulator